MDDCLERQCQLCELHVYGEKMNTGPHNLCEGSRCDEAIEYLEEELADEKQDKYKYLLIG